jgi:hypothetical protein
MAKIRGLILLTICLVIWLSGCGDSTGGYGIFRSRDIIIVFVPLPDTSEIAEVKVDNKALHIDIDTGEKIVPRVIRLQRRLFQVVEPDETLEIHGKNRINDYAVIHLRAFDTKYKVSKFINLSVSKFYDFKITNSREKPEPFENSGAFRVGDKIMAYCRLQDNVDSPLKAFKINVGGVEIKHTTATVNTHMITEGEIGERLLIIEKYKIDSDKTVRDLHFLLKDLEPHETVKIKEMMTLGSRIAIAELAIVPQDPQPPNDVIITDR